jgi:hypothetical protein
VNRVRLCLRQADSFGDAFARTPQARPRRDPGGSNPEKSNSQDLSCAATHGETWLIERMSTDLEEGKAWRFR